METNRMLDQIKETVEDVVRQITRKQNISPAELEHLTKSVCLIEKINKIEEGSGDYSERGGSYNSNASRSGGDDEYSYRRGRSPMTGRYVSRDSGNSSRDSSHRYYGGGSRNSGYSGHSMRDRAIAKLEEMYDEAATNHERQWLDEWISHLRD